MTITERDRERAVGVMSSTDPGWRIDTGVSNELVDAIAAALAEERERAAQTAEHVASLHSSHRIVEVIVAAIRRGTP